MWYTINVTYYKGRVKIIALLLLGLLAFPLVGQPSSGQRILSQRTLSTVTSQLHSFNVDRIGPTLTHPWSIAFLPGGDMLISERGGTLYRYHNQERHQVTGLPAIRAFGQGGLLDFEPHPNFARNNLILFSFTEKRSEGYGTSVARAKLVGNALEELRIIFRAQPSSFSKLHFGSRISFLADGTLLVSLGDRGTRHEAQNLTNHNGTLVRININGSAPINNPFVNRSALRSEIYSYGHRNIQGLAVEPGSENIYLHEHGPRGGDEINLVVKGRNYGWPRVTYGKEYATNAKIGIGNSAPGYIDPLLQWTPSIAPSGLMIYSGRRFPRWRGHLFVGALAGRYIARVELSQGRALERERLLEKELGRIRDIKEDQDGNIWFITDERRGSLYKISF